MNPRFHCAASGLFAVVLLSACAGPRPLFGTSLEKELADCERILAANIDDSTPKALAWHFINQHRIGCGLKANGIERARSKLFQLSQDEAIIGLIEIRFFVLPEGKVKSAAVEKNDTGHPNLGLDLVKLISAARFSVWSNAVTATYRVEFKQTSVFYSLNVL